MNKKVIDLIFQVKSGCHAKEDEIREKLNLSPAEFRAILTLEPGAAVPCNVLSKKMFLSVSRGSRVIEKLLKGRLIRETKGEKDRRIINVMLTDKGIKAQERILKVFEECEREILKRIPKKDLEIFTVSLNKISDILISN